MFAYPCPSCGHRLLATPERAGQRTICSKCLKPIVIPSPEAVGILADKSENLFDSDIYAIGGPAVESHSAGFGLPEDPIPDFAAPPPTEGPAAVIMRPGADFSRPPNFERPRERQRDFELLPDPTFNESLPTPTIFDDSTPMPGDMPSEVAPAPSGMYDPDPTPVPVPMPVPRIVTPIPPPPSRPDVMLPKAPSTPRTTAIPPAPLPPLTPIVETPPPTQYSARPPARITMGRNEAESRDLAGMVAFAPTGIESADIAAELTAALTMRMKPPPEPPSDLKLSTGLWLTLSAVGLSLWAFSLVYSPHAIVYTALIGIVEIVIGYFWVAYIAGRRNPMQGAIALLPPINAIKMFRPTSIMGYRPARFAVTGVALLGLVAAAPLLRPFTQKLLGMDEATAPPVVFIDDSWATKLRDQVAASNEIPLQESLRELAEKNKDLRSVTSATDKANLVVELQKLLKNENPETRRFALSALVGWVDDAAKPDVLYAIQNGTERERRAAMKIASRWAEPAVAKLYA
ncbi:MAG: hypothetical protein ACRCZF_25670, partial [Gemmataceae bacterium]